MKSSRIMSLAVISLCLVVLASFTLKSRNQSTRTTYTEKNMVFKVSYDETSSKLVATEKLQVDADMLQRGSDGRITYVNKEGINSQMPMASRVMMESMVGSKPVVEMFALVSFQSPAGDKLTMAPTDEQLFDFAKKSYESFKRHTFTGQDYSVSGDNFNCAGSSCSAEVPAGIEVFVWRQK